MTISPHQPSRSRGTTRRGFSLIELVITIAILGTVAAVAVPRMSRAADGADIAATKADTGVLNKALEMYRAEHGRYPVATKIVPQLTMYTNQDGSVSRSKPDPSAGIEYGPYLVKIPPLKLGPNAGASGIDVAAGNGVGWIYDVETRRIRPNLFGADGREDASYLDKLNLPELDEDAGGVVDP